ncbi:hypothetical protein ATERTT37_000002 [Aspergillus terreus]
MPVPLLYKSYGRQNGAPSFCILTNELEVRRSCREIVLELGTFTGVSALAFYEATKDTLAEIITIDISERFLKIAQDAFNRYGATDRIHVVQGACLQMLATLEGEFDLIYIDAANDEYEDYTRFILDNKLLSRRGVILVDDTLHEGTVFEDSLLEKMQKEKHPVYVSWADPVHNFNRYAASEERVYTTLLPIFNGVTQIMWR